ncbi:hypothetical protein [Myxacorys almedinensis]|uniref:Uncharacterized protein n=1 Tax=Myxacorys almedinensis A TaxID=2690445 RepID=A0A8J8CLU9_9CYAN|nr:hypothetical protein [Myxacorys almedinensis]NDJ18125.1 hypothetical protein [Myxacorys almedinensis A]
MRKRWIGGLISLLGITTVGYAYSLVAATPEQVLLRPFACPDQPDVAAKNFQVLSVRKWDKGVVALYRGACPAHTKRLSNDPNREKLVLSYRVVKRTGREWHAIGSGNHHSTGSRSASKFIDYGVGKTSENPKHSPDLRRANQYAVFFGEVISPMVSAVEVTFNNGKILRDSSTDGLFLLVSSGASRVCDVRVLGADNQILQRDEIAPPTAQISQSNTCQPISGRL